MMRIGTMTPGSGSWQPPSASDKLAREQGAELSVERVRDEKKVAPEQILDKIKGLTEGGAHSVRFEMDDVTKTLVVKVYDRTTDELIRQVPAEEVLDMAKALQEFRGMFVDAKS